MLSFPEITERVYMNSKNNIELTVSEAHILVREDTLVMTDQTQNQELAETL